MLLEWAVVGEVAKPLFGAIVGALGKSWFERKPKLVTFYGSISTHQVSPPGQAPFKVYTHEVVIRNVGKKPAQNVRLTHYVLPDFHVSPPTQFTTEENASTGAKDILIPTMVPGEQVVVSYLYWPPLMAGGVNAGIRHGDGFATQKEVLLQPQVPKGVTWLAGSLMFLGFGTLLYLVSIGAGRLVALLGL